MTIAKPKVIWLTGLSGSGKTTIANELIKLLPRTVLLDGDVLRDGINRDLGFSVEDRNENIRRVSHIAQILFSAGVNVVVSFISPIKSARAFARSLIPSGSFYEVYLSTTLDECKKRDVKGLYKKAEAGVIKEFTGISSPYERPERPEIEIDTEGVPLKYCVDIIIAAIGAKLD